MKFTLFLGFVFAMVLSSCSLSADQESSLNNAKTSFINSKNNGAVMSYVAFTHPDVVSYYKEMGDSVFQTRFDLSSSEYNAFLTNGNIRKITQSNPKIHVKYEFTNVNMEDTKLDDAIIYAISNNDGESWFFAESEDYMNNDIFKEKNRLIKE